MARQIQQVRDDTVMMFERGREYRLKNIRRFTTSGLSLAEKQAFLAGLQYEEQALRTGEAPEVPEQYRKDLV